MSSPAGTADSAPRPLLRVALTGGIATGKSYCLNRFALLGAAVIDADVLARRAVGPGTSGLKAVRARFGASVIRPDHTLDRAALGRIVFADEQARRDLEAIVHPLVFGAMQYWFARQEDQARQSGSATVAIADVPLLFETGRQDDFDQVVVAACSPGQQLARLVARGGLSEDDARARIRSQIPIDEKRRQADHVVDTSGTIEETDAEVNRVWDALAPAAKP